MSRVDQVGAAIAALGDSPDADLVRRALAEFDVRDIAAWLVSTQGAGGGSLPAGWTVDDPEAGNLNGNRGAEVGTAALNGIQSIDASPDPSNPDPTADLAIKSPNGLNLNDLLDLTPDDTTATFNGTVDLNSNQLTGLTSPSGPSDAVSFDYATNNFLTEDGLFANATALGTLAEVAAGGTRPELPALPDVQDIADALVALGLVTQAA